MILVLELQSESDFVTIVLVTCSSDQTPNPGPSSPKFFHELSCLFLFPQHSFLYVKCEYKCQYNRFLLSNKPIYNSLKIENGLV